MDLVDKEGTHAALVCARNGWWCLLTEQVLPLLKQPAKVRSLLE
jgi:hypothetical protein